MIRLSWSDPILAGEFGKVEDFIQALLDGARHFGVRELAIEGYGFAQGVDHNAAFFAAGHVFANLGADFL